MQRPRPNEPNMPRTKASSSADPLEDHPRYEKEKNLNAGAFGFVQLARDKMNKGAHVAVKFIPRGERINEYVEAEIINHRQLLHPHIIQFQEVFLTEQYLGIAMEYANGGDSFEYVRKKGGLQENEARWFFQQLIVALDYCHRKGVVNRDVKLENTLIHWAQKPLLKICDFGYSKDEKYQSAPASRVGTPAYLAPEVILNKKGDTYNGKQADVWSCGVMLFVTLVGQYPFERPEDKGDPQKLHKMIRRIVQIDYQFPSRVSVSEGCQDMLSKILVADPDKRFTIQQIIEHPWFKQDLPSRALKMNDEYISLSPDGPGFQQLSEIKAILKAAMQPLTQRKHEDDLIADVIGL